MIAAGAFAGSALVSSVAVANDEPPPIDQPELAIEPAAATPSPAIRTSTDPSPTDRGGVDTIDIDRGDGDVVSGEAPDPPFDEIAVVEMVMPSAEAVVATITETAAPSAEPVAATMAEATAPVAEVGAADPTETTPAGTASHAATPGDATSAPAPDATPTADEPGEEHEGGSGGQGNPYRMTFTVTWLDPNGTPIGVLDAMLPIDWRSVFVLSAASETGKGMPTSATCTYPDDSEVLRCVFDNPGHGSGTDGLIVPARPTATYTVTVAWPSPPDWTIDGANADAYSARDLCPRAGGETGGDHEGGDGHESGGGHESSSGEADNGHESGGEEPGTGHESGSEEGRSAYESGGGGRGVSCEHTVVLQQVAGIIVPPPIVPPPIVSPPVAEPEPEPTPPVVLPTPPGVEPEVEVEALPPVEAVPPVEAPPTATPINPTSAVAPTATAPRSLPTTGASISMIILISALLIGIGSAAALLSRRTSAG